MTIIFNDGFETGDLTNWTGTDNDGNAPTADNTIAHVGSWSMKSFLVAATPTVRCYEYKTVGTTNPIYHRAYVRFSALPDGFNTFWFLTVYDETFADHVCKGGIICNGGTDYSWRMMINEGGVKTYYATATLSPIPSINTWYCMELYYLANSSPNGEATFYIDDTVQLTQTGKDTSFPGTAERVCIGVENFAATNQNVTVYTDDDVVADIYIGPIVPSTGVKKSYGDGLSWLTYSNNYRNRFPKFHPRTLGKYPNISY